MMTRQPSPWKLVGLVVLRPVKAKFFSCVLLFSGVAALQFIPAQSSVKKAEILGLLGRKP